MPVFRLEQIAQLLDAKLEGDSQLEINAIATLSQAQAGQLSFFTNSKYLAQLRDTQASVVLVKPEHAVEVPCAKLVIDNPYLAYAHLSKHFEEVLPRAIARPDSLHIDPSAKISSSAQLGPNVVVGANSRIGNQVYIGANSVIGAGCSIADRVRINANVTLYNNVEIGENSLVHSAAVLGADGFGFAPDAGKWQKISQLGGIKIGANVEIGAGTTIDCAALTDTLIADGVKLDNQIQIAHGVEIGANTAIAACTAIAGSTKIGAHCTIAGAVGIAGHLTIADGCHVTAMSLVTKSLFKAGAYSSGTALMPTEKWRKSVVRFRQLDDLAKQVKHLKEQNDIK